MIDLHESRRRKTAIAIFGLLIVVFILISAASFAGARNRPDPQAIRFQGQTAVDGKRVFQAYNCMGCHTLVGNGAYFAPDLTAVYGGNGPAWLMSFLSTLDVWPDRDRVNPWIEQLAQSGEAEGPSVDAYYEKFEGAASDTVDRGGWGLLMPNLHIKEAEASALVAYLNYVSQINTEGWPPEPGANPDLVGEVQATLHARFLGPRPTPTP